MESLMKGFKMHQHHQAELALREFKAACRGRIVIALGIKGLCISLPLNEYWLQGRSPREAVALCKRRLRYDN